jgi:hypothetical protein
MNPCIPVEEMGTLKQLPDDDPRRRHVATCPRCSSLMFAYEEFMQAQAVNHASTGAAEASLSAFIAAHIEGGTAERISGAPRRGRGRWYDLSLLRFAAVAAAVALVAVAVVRWQPWESKEIVYRGEPAQQFSGLSAARVEDGSIEMHWGAVKNADSYRVTILAPDLSEIARLTPAPQLSARFDARSDASPSPAYWQVTALLEGAEILTSDPQPLPQAGELH